MVNCWAVVFVLWAEPTIVFLSHGKTYLYI